MPKSARAAGLKISGLPCSSGDDDGVADAVEDRPQDLRLLLEHLLCLGPLEHLRLEGRVGLGEFGRSLSYPDLQLVVSLAERFLRLASSR